MDELTHRPAAYHAFFAGFISREREMMQTGFALAEGVACCGPAFGFPATAANRAGRLSIGKEKHLGAAPLRCRAAGVCDRGNHDAFAARVRFTNQSIEIILSNRSHDQWHRLQSVLCAS